MSDLSAFALPCAISPAFEENALHAGEGCIMWSYGSIDVALSLELRGDLAGQDACLKTRPVGVCPGAG